ncbi:MAG: FAD-binding protein, partial [Candidatus Brocadiia bacterium]
GYGVCRRDVVELVVREGPARIRELVKLGTHFDMVGNGDFNLTREGGHSSRRILHALGDRTGSEIERSLCDAVRSNSRITVMESTFAIDLLVEGGNCLGALVLTPDRKFAVVSARSTIISTGGFCQVYRETSNPETATGDGIAMAYRAGARIEDMEFVQFHPTTLYMAGAPRFLITEAARGEGAFLLNVHLERFMPRYSPQAELAPRDVVSRAILAEAERTRSSSVFLDMRHLGPMKVRERFPQVTRVLADYGLDIGTDLIPVFPSAHYSIGGIKVDTTTRTTVGRLFSCGEAAATGFHGANRLGSNSLLESLVFGEIAGQNAAVEALESAHSPAPMILAVCESGEKVDSAFPDVEMDIADARNSLKSLMWRHCGIVREEAGLEEALSKIKQWARYMVYRRFTTLNGWELQNLLMVARLVVDAALTRTESRGVHFRREYQKPDPDWQRHIYLER